jgi:hypothetical protein
MVQTGERRGHAGQCHKLLRTLGGELAQLHTLLLDLLEQQLTTASHIRIPVFTFAATEIVHPRGISTTVLRIMHSRVYSVEASLCARVSSEGLLFGRTSDLPEEEASTSVSSLPPRFSHQRRARDRQGFSYSSHLNISTSTSTSTSTLRGQILPTLLFFFSKRHLSC